MKPRTTVLTAAALAAAFVMTPAATSVASAQVRDRTSVRDVSVDRVKTRCLAAISRRQDAITHLNDVLNNHSNLTDEHHQVLLQIDSQTSTGLTALANTIQAETDGTKLRAECHQIVDDYRVYVLVRPRARLVVAGDRELAAVAKLDDAAAKIQSAIDRAKANGKDTTKAEADLATMKSNIATASQHASAIYEEVIHITPSTYAPGVLEPGRNDARTAHDAIRAAAQAGHAAVSDLRAASGTSTSTSTTAS